jgi:hypothetical protein
LLSRRQEQKSDIDDFGLDSNPDRLQAWLAKAAVSPTPLWLLRRRAQKSDIFGPGDNPD